MVVEMEVIQVNVLPAFSRYGKGRRCLVLKYSAHSNFTNLLHSVVFHTTYTRGWQMARKNGGPPPCRKRRAQRVRKRGSWGTYGHGAGLKNRPDHDDDFTCSGPPAYYQIKTLLGRFRKQQTSLPSPHWRMPLVPDAPALRPGCHMGILEPHVSRSSARTVSVPLRALEPLDSRATTPELPARYVVRSFPRGAPLGPAIRGSLSFLRLLSRTLEHGHDSPSSPGARPQIFLLLGFVVESNARQSLLVDGILLPRRAVQLPVQPCRFASRVHAMHTSSNVFPTTSHRTRAVSPDFGLPEVDSLPVRY